MGRSTGARAYQGAAAAGASRSVSPGAREAGGAGGRLKTLASVLAACLLVVGVLLIAFQLTAPRWIPATLEAKIREKCPDCDVHIGKVDVDVFQGRVTGSKISLNRPPGASAGVTARTEGVRADLSLQSLWNLRWDVRSLRLDGLFVSWKAPLRSPEKKTPSGSGGDPLRQLPPVRVENTEIRGGEFEYVDLRHDSPARISFRDLDVDTGPWGTRPGLSPESVEIQARAEIGGKGELVLRTRIGLFEREGKDRFELSARNVNLSNLNSFLVASKGLRLRGDLILGQAQLVRSGGDLTGRLSLDYRDLDLHFVPGRGGQSAPSAELKDLAAKIVAAKDRGGGPRAPASVPIRAHRKPEEGVPGFLLSSLADAVKEIVKG